MTIHAISFDFDGCLANAHYINSAKKDIVTSNDQLLNAIKAENKLYKKNIVLIGSSRQSKRRDDQSIVVEINNRQINIGSCFPAIQKISQYLNAQFDPLLLADAYGQLPTGISFAKATQKEDQDTTHSDWIADATKTTILYAQMHKIASEHPNESIIFDFYDDRIEEILRPLYLAYDRHEELIPKRITLRLYHYEGTNATLYQTIEGTGFIDLNYTQTIQDMTFATINGLGGDGDASPIYVADYLSQKDLENRVPFKNTSLPIEEILAKYAALRKQLKIIQDKADALKRKQHHKAAEKAEYIVTTIKGAMQNVLQGSLNKKGFAEKCQKAIDSGRAELETHRGWSEALTNLALVLAGVIGFLVKGCINYASNRNFLFVHKTRSAQMLDTLESCVEGVIPTMG